MKCEKREAEKRNFRHESAGVGNHAKRLVPGHEANCKKGQRNDNLCIAKTRHPDHHHFKCTAFWPEMV